jgi:hypothetical protein
MSTVQIRLPDSVLEQAKELANEDQIPLDYFVALAVAERVSALRGIAYLEQRAKRGSAAKLKEILGRAPDVEPDPADRIGR